MQSSRRLFLSALPLAGAPLLLHAKDNPLPVAKTNVADFALTTMAKSYNNLKKGLPSKVDLATAQTAVSMLSIHWEETGVHQWINKELQQAISANPRAVATQQTADQMVASMRR